MSTIEEKYFHSGDNIIYSQKRGTGSKPLFVFHGFGQDHQLFKWLSEEYPENYQYYLFDVFYHGNSTRPEKALSKKEWGSLVRKIIKEENINRFDVLCFSLGGRFGIATVCEFASKIDIVRLIAPDAILISIWYRFSTTPFFRSFFKYLMKNPDKFFSLLNTLEKYKLVNRTLIQFARKELRPKDSRIQVYRSWIFLKPLKYPSSYFIKQANKYKIDVRFLLGSKDRIIPPEDVEIKLKGLQKVSYQVVPLKHHELVKPEFVRLLF